MSHRQPRLVDKLVEARSELDLRRREAEDALRAKSRFIAGLSHEFRTPLTSVIGYAEWLSQSLDDPARRQSRAIARAGQHMLSLVDNLLDDPAVDPGAKRAFNQRFGWRLGGRRVGASSAAEAAPFRMVERIEEEFPRREYGDVYESLLAIHRGQVLSLRQQAAPALTHAELLAISCEKGGSSVLADLYLVRGTPGPEEERFAFGWYIQKSALGRSCEIEKICTLDN